MAPSGRRYHNNGVSNNSNLVSVNVSNDGNRLVGPLGLKKAEQELIKRRYKYMHGDRENISRIPLVQGN